MTDLKKEINLDEDDDVPPINKDKFYKNKKKYVAPFNSKARRFEYKTNKVNLAPGPGNYHDNGNTWNKRTYNILFAEI